MSERDSYPVVPEDEVPDRPRVVEEAYDVLGVYGWQLLGAGAAAALAWYAANFWLGLLVPLSWLLVTLAVLVVLFVAPVAREPRLARDVLRRWDDLRVERALESSGIVDDPRLEVAEAMADRVLRHPSVDDRVRSTTRALVSRLRLLLKDLRRVRWLAEAKSRVADRGVARSISDLEDLLDARIADILSRLAELHSTVVLRDAVALERVVGGVEGLLHELEAEREVERLLADAERRPTALDER